MPKNLFRRFLPDRAWLGRQRSLQYALGDLIHDPNLWNLNRRSVSGGIAIGVLIAWLPLPAQMAAAALLALSLRVNLPLAVIATWISNPLTMAPMYWSGYSLGVRLLGERPPRSGFEPSVQWFMAEFYRIWEPLLLGCLLLGALSAATAYALTRLLWRWQILRQINRRARLRRARRRGAGNRGAESDD
ncbi:MAG: DUF2062 domain-containing protein [Halofilum sp. (in: g-proteobacteria)]